MCIKDDTKEWVFFFGESNLYLIPTTISIFCAFLLGYILNNVTQTSTSMSSKFIVLGNHDATVRSIKPEDDSNLPYVMPNPFANGSIVFRDVKLEFWPDSQPSWRGLSFHVQSGEKIGILGLPGSGKTAIIGALYKLANLSQGSVYIGDVDIKTAPVDYVRSSIALVPKNPLMFSGTLRINIDPMHRYSLRELCESLEKVGIYQKIEDLPNLLETQTYYIEERLSVQERQLLYVAQAVLRDPKILILEEPIEPVGTKDMFKVLDVVEQLFHCTILVVAHNMKYAAKCDRIIIVKDGQVAEFDTPENLFRNPNSCFSQMLSTSAENLLETEV
ncbi:Probable multidrug resistance-associated protein lethal(2)03659 [Gryllus bimaculatus]|nr:Probable multidrug resistance-associated protein lethal(2)03659 [Gryllus bimaculatus]